MFLLFTFFIGSSGFSIMKVLLDMLRHYIFLLIHWSPGWLYSPPGWAEWPLTPHMHSPQFYRDPDTAGARENRYRLNVLWFLVFCVASEPLPETLILTPNPKVKKCGGTLFIIFHIFPTQKLNFLTWGYHFVWLPLYDKENHTRSG